MRVSSDTRATSENEHSTDSNNRRKSHKDHRLNHLLSTCSDARIRRGRTCAKMVRQQRSRRASYRIHQDNVASQLESWQVHQAHQHELANREANNHCLHLNLSADSTLHRACRFDKRPLKSTPGAAPAATKFLLLATVSILLLAIELSGANRNEPSRTQATTTISPPITSPTRHQQANRPPHHYQDASGSQTATTSIKDRNVIQSTAFNGAPVPSQGRQVERNRTATAATRTMTTPTAGHQDQRQHINNNHHQQQQRQASHEPLATSKLLSLAPLVEYHLSHLSPPPLVPITVQKQQQQVATKQRAQVVATASNFQPSSPDGASQAGQWRAQLSATSSPAFDLTKNNLSGPPLVSSVGAIESWRAAGEQAPPVRAKTPNSTGGDPDLMTAAASSVSAVVASDPPAPSNGLVQLQLPLQLHLKLKPLALPMPPPPSVRQQQVGAVGLPSEAKRRRSLGEQHQKQQQQQQLDQSYRPGPNTTSTVATPTTNATPTMTTTTTTLAPRPPTPRAKPGGNLAKYAAAVGRRHSFEGDLKAFTWREAKRVLLMNSIAPPLVQAAHRVLERRHSLLGSLEYAPNSKAGSARNQRDAPLTWSDTATTPTSTTPMTPTDVTTSSSAATSTMQPESGRFLVEASAEHGKLERPKQLADEVVETNSGSRSEAAAFSKTPPLSQARAHGQQQTKQGHQHQQQLELQQQRNDKRLGSMYQIELNDLSIGGHRHATSHVEPAFTGAHEDEARIQQMAAAMLPFVWPSFQLTAGQSLAKLRVRSLDDGSRSQAGQSQQTITTASPTSVAPTWPMKYQQLTRVDRDQKSGSTTTETPTTATSGRVAPVAASEHKPTFVDMEEELERDRARRLRSVTPAQRDASLNTTSSTQAPTTTTVTPTSTTSKPVPSARQLLESSRRKRRKKPNTGSGSGSSYLQQQQQRLERQRHQLQMKRARAKAAAAAAVAANASLTTEPSQHLTPPTPSDSTRLASSYPLPRIKFNASTSSPSAASSSDVLPERVTRPTMTPSGAERSSVVSSAKPAQIPISLSRLIEQQLAQATAASNSTSSPSTVQRNLLLLREYFSARQNWSALASSSTSKLMMPPTTSVSKVVRLNQSESGGRNASGSLQTGQLQPQTGRDWLEQLQANSSAQQADVMRTGSNLIQATLEDGPRARARSPSWVGVVGGAGASDQHATEPSVELDRAPLQAPSKTSAKTTTTTTVPPTTSSNAPAAMQHQEADLAAEIGSNKILPDDDEPTPSTTPTTSTATEVRTSKAQQRAAANMTMTTETTTNVRANSSKSTLAPMKSSAAQAKSANDGAGFASKNKNNRRQKHDPNLKANNNNKNIKLFHFKRKPDMNKLPFYKKPLNYTELGWSAEEIERDQRRFLELQQFSGQGGDPDTPINSDGDTGELDQDEDEPSVARAQSEHSDNTGNTSVAKQQVASGSVQKGNLNLLKRKRRARSQFERLMAELQAAAVAGATSAGEHQQQSAGVGSQQVAGSSSQANDEQRVPVMRKKAEPLVMKPMFFNVNQKRRQTNVTIGSGHSESLTTAASVTTTTTTTTTTSTTQRPTNKPGLDAARNKPIVRMRRKDHGEHGPPSLEPEPVSTPWRPTRPNWLVSSSEQRHTTVPLAPVKLMLVPSGLLTPSGSHPMPLFAATSAQAASWSSSAPADVLQRPSEQRPSPVTALQASLAARPANVPAGQQSPMAKPQLMATANSASTGELRVPKLLVKPMRPAKYSLNGYIPKPSLSQMQPAAAAAPMSHQAGLMQAALGAQQAQTTGRGNQKAAKRNQQPAIGQQKHSSLLTNSGQLNNNNNNNNKDLDSSTSNEIFSRRRGIEQAANDHNNNLSGQQARFGKSTSVSELAGLLVAPIVAQTAADSPASPLINNGNHRNPMQVLQQQRIQMEENKRKYVKQHQQANSFRSPTLSIQKANQIKAKLGLSASLNSIRPKHSTASGGLMSSGSSLAADNNRSHNKQSGWPLAHDSGQQQQQVVADDQQQSGAASTNRISALDPPVADDPIAGAHAHLFSGTGGAYNTIPRTDFECTDKKGQFVSGLFADVKTGCRVWHLCSNNRKYSFLCPTGTIFNSKVNSCDWKHSVRCGGGDS